MPSVYFIVITLPNQSTIIMTTYHDILHLHSAVSPSFHSLLISCINTFSRLKHQSSALSLLKSLLCKILPRFLCTKISSGNTSSASVSMIKLSLHPTHKICGFAVPDEGMKSRGTGSVRYCFWTAVLKSKGIFEDEVEIHLLIFLTREICAFSAFLMGVRSQLSKFCPAALRQNMEFVLRRQASFGPSGLENR